MGYLGKPDQRSGLQTDQRSGLQPGCLAHNKEIPTMTEHIHLKRLERVWVNNPIFFITCCTHRKQPILANAKIVSILVEEWTGALERHGWVIGRYVVMPDHVHFFCAPMGGMGDPACKDLSVFMQQWKQWTSKRIIRECSPDGPSGLQETQQAIQRFEALIWQARFFDHLIRSQESYSQKWDYVRQNPVRAGLVKNPEEWLWQGQIQEL
jgi:putative transposase